MPSRRVRHLMFSSKALGPLVSYFVPSITNTSDSTAISILNDLSGNSNNATQSTTAKKPLYKINTMGGMPSLAYDNTYAQNLTLTSNLTTVRTTISVVSQTGYADYKPFLLGSTTAADFNRGTGGLLWSSQYTSASIKNGFTYFNGVSQNTATASITNSNKLIITVTTTGNIQFNNISDDRVYARSWYGYRGCDIAFSFVLSSAIKSRIEKALGYTFRIATQ